MTTLGDTGDGLDDGAALSDDVAERGKAPAPELPLETAPEETPPEEVPELTCAAAGLIPARKMAA